MFWIDSQSTVHSCAKAQYILTFLIYFWKLVLRTLALVLVFIDAWMFCFVVMPTVLFNVFTRVWNQFLAYDPNLLWQNALLENGGLISLRWFGRSRFEPILSLAWLTIDELFVRWGTQLPHSVVEIFNSSYKWEYVRILKWRQ